MQCNQVQLRVTSTSVYKHTVALTTDHMINCTLMFYMVVPSCDHAPDKLSMHTVALAASLAGSLLHWLLQ
jgi:hypothetical protein